MEADFHEVINAGATWCAAAAAGGEDFAKIARILGSRCFSEHPTSARSMPQESPYSLSSARFSDFQSL